MPNRIFIKPNPHLAKSAAERIFGELQKSLPKNDFFGTYIIAPTKSSAILILSELVKIADAQNYGGVSGLECITPEVFLEKAASEYPQSDIIEVFGAFKKVIENLNDEDCVHLLPQGAETLKDFFALAKPLKRLRGLCGEAGKTFADAAKITEKQQLADAARWAELAEIEKRYLTEIHSLQKLDPDEALIMSVKKPSRSLNAKRVILAGLADAPKIFFDLLAALEGMGGKIDIIIFGEDESSFNEWGLPLDPWREREIGIDDSSIAVTSDQREQAEQIAESIVLLGDGAPRISAIACEEGESSLYAMTELAAKGIKSFSPSGEKLSGSDAFAFAQALQNYCSNADEPATFALLRTPPLIAYLSRKTELPAMETRSILDCFKAEKLCANIACGISLSRNPKERLLFEEAEKLLSQKTSNVGEHIARIFQEVLVPYESPSPFYNEACEALSRGIKLLKNSLRAGFDFEISKALKLVIDFCDDRVFDCARESGQVYIKNWLEIFWTPENNIFIADFNDGKVPEKIFGDSFLPDSLRTALGIRNSAFRHARDSYMAHTLVASRKNSGQVRFFVPRQDFNGEPLRPSRLLLQNPRNVISRVELLFGEKPSQKHASTFVKAWDFKPSFKEIPDSLSATDFKAYLDCPFRFYLERILKLKAFDPSKAELDAMQIGSLVHFAFQEISKTQTHDASEIYEILEDTFNSRVRKTFGRNIPPAVKFQAQAMLARLKAASFAEAEHRASGWRTAYAEEDFSGMEIGGFKIKARIDRIDQNQDGEYLIIDYKTSESFGKRKSAGIAESAHIKGRSANGGPAWTDLQLPVYREAAMRKLGTDKILCAYFILPQTPDETKIDIWNIASDQQISAMDEAERIAGKIRNREFMPSANTPLVKYYPEYFGFTDAKDLKNFISPRS